MSRKHSFHLSSSQTILLGFLLVILSGSFLLMLPQASVSATPTSFFDALFTATSAVCVTGLVVHDTASYWSAFGQMIILLLIQIGGLGVITIAILLNLLSGKKIGLFQRSTLQNAISAPSLGGVIRTIIFTFKVCFLIECIGVLLLYPVFSRMFPGIRGIWYALFHSVSAFCNAGFDLMGCTEQYSSLTSFSSDPLLNLVICSLILLGGIGFVTWKDLAEKKLNFRRYNMQTKVILTTTLILVILPVLYFFFFTFRDAPLGERALLSLFQSVTPRTAGFNTADFSVFSENDKLLTIILMLIGGSPGSTAGGMKTTTVAVLLSTCLSICKQQEETTLFQRFISIRTIKTALTIFFLYLSLFLGGGVLIHQLESLPILTCLFETASAIGTVGLTLGITPSLGILSRCILIFLMFFGRVGGLTLIFAALSVKANNVHYPMEPIMIG